MKIDNGLKKHNDLKWDIRLKVWFEIDGHPIIGDGRLAMLNSIHQNGSIIDAAREIGVSYRKIRGALCDMEKHIGQPLVKAYRGGGHGGGATLTPLAHKLIEEYTKIRNGFEQDVSSYQQEASFMLQSNLAKILPSNGSFCPSLKNTVLEKTI
ncbi:MAG: LysR family transcriptional regulator [Desulfamplus sp.]|nr:LysR family transcriptional regulator [Desulfamplus sp.]MBF0412730.1 LysR family transcriptional regulator [Desulfamplus sp.]